MKKEDIVKIVVEGVASIVIGLVADGFSKKLKEQAKKNNFDQTLVGDLTVSELKTILKEEEA